MKKILFLFVMVLTAVTFASARDVVTKDVNKLPMVARNFIKHHFPSAKISYIKIDNEGSRVKDYEVKLSDNTEIDFDSVGNWQEVDANKGRLPGSLIPIFVTNYMKNNNFVEEYVTKMERSRKGYEVKLNTGLTLKFDNQGNFRKMDD